MLTAHHLVLVPTTNPLLSFPRVGGFWADVVVPPEHCARCMEHALLVLGVRADSAASRLHHCSANRYDEMDVRLACGLTKN